MIRACHNSYTLTGQTLPFIIIDCLPPPKSLLKVRSNELLRLLGLVRLPLLLFLLAILVATVLPFWFALLARALRGGLRRVGIVDFVRLLVAQNDFLPLLPDLAVLNEGNALLNLGDEHLSVTAP